MFSVLPFRTGQRVRRGKKWKKTSKQHRNIFLEAILASPVAGSRATTDMSKTRVRQEKCY